MQLAEDKLNAVESKASNLVGLDADGETEVLESVKLHHEMLDAERKVCRVSMSESLANGAISISHWYYSFQVEKSHFHSKWRMLRKKMHQSIIKN